MVKNEDMKNFSKNETWKIITLIAQRIMYTNLHRMCMAVYWIGVTTMNHLQMYIVLLSLMGLWQQMNDWRTPATVHELLEQP
jgi:hypothetical protein